MQGPKTHDLTRTETNAGPELSRVVHRHSALVGSYFVLSGINLLRSDHRPKRFRKKRPGRILWGDPQKMVSVQFLLTQANAPSGSSRCATRKNELTPFWRPGILPGRVCGWKTSPELSNDLAAILKRASSSDAGNHQAKQDNKRRWRGLVGPVALRGISPRTHRSEFQLRVMQDIIEGKTAYR